MPPRTLIQALADAAERRGGGHIYVDGEGERFSSYAEIAEDAERLARRMAGAGVRRLERVGLVFARPDSFVRAFFAVMRAGAIPVPMATAATTLPIGLEAVALASRTSLILCDTLEHALHEAQARLPALQRIMTLGEIEAAPPAGSSALCMPAGDDIAFLQYTSGSTASPRGVVNLHQSVSANARGIIERARLDAATDTCVSWLPLYHDMGLIGLVIVPLIAGVPVVLMPTSAFARRPSVWFAAVHRHRGTVSFAPNFAFALALRRLRAHDVRSWDLSCLRLLGCGAEPLDAEVLARFAETFERHCKLPQVALTPAYGLAEASLCVTMGEPGTGLIVDGRVVSCGAPLADHGVRILAPDGKPLADRCQGEIVVTGPGVAHGYFIDPKATAGRFKRDGLHTGDLGYLADGRLFVSGRSSDLIICNGRNFFAGDIEAVAARTPGCTAGAVVAFAVPGQGTEEVVVVAELQQSAGATVLRAIAERIVAELGIAVKDVVGVRRGSLPRTSSGKLQRGRARASYLARSGLEAEGRDLVDSR